MQLGEYWFNIGINHNIYNTPNIGIININKLSLKKVNDSVDPGTSSANVDIIAHIFGNWST